MARTSDEFNEYVRTYSVGFGRDILLSVRQYTESAPP